MSPNPPKLTGPGLGAGAAAAAEGLGWPQSAIELSSKPWGCSSGKKLVPRLFPDGGCPRNPSHPYFISRDPSGTKASKALSSARQGRSLGL